MHIASHLLPLFTAPVVQLFSLSLLIQACGHPTAAIGSSISRSLTPAGGKAYIFGKPTDSRQPQCVLQFCGSHGFLVCYVTMMGGCAVDHNGEMNAVDILFPSQIINCRSLFSWPPCYLRQLRSYNPFQLPRIPAVKFSTFWGITVSFGKCLHSHVPNEPVRVTAYLVTGELACSQHRWFSCFPYHGLYKRVDIQLRLSYLPFLVL